MKFHLPTINQFASLLFLTLTNAIFQLIVVAILIHNSDSIKLGLYFIALSIASLLSILVNYGTMQTSIVEYKRAQTELEKNKVVAETITLRFFPLILSVLIIMVLPLFAHNGVYFLLILPFVISEFINPQFYLIAEYKITEYAFINIGLRILLVVGLFLFPDKNRLVEYALVGTGIIMLLLNMVYMKSVFLKKINFNIIPDSKTLVELYKKNSLILGNSLTVHLQQSMFLFALPAFVTPVFLSAYGFIDKLISSFRLLVNAYSSSLMPQAIHKHTEGEEGWRNFKKQQNIFISIFCLVAAVILFCFPEQLLVLLLMGKKNNNLVFFNEVVGLFKMISFVPLIIALNVLNALEIFLYKKYLSYFGAGVALLFISLLCIDAFKLGLPQSFVGYYPLVIESAALLISFYIVKNRKNA